LVGSKSTSACSAPPQAPLTFPRETGTEREVSFVALTLSVTSSVLFVPFAACITVELTATVELAVTRELFCAVLLDASPTSWHIEGERETHRESESRLRV
jgi:hypothetical protein